MGGFAAYTINKVKLILTMPKILVRRSNIFPISSTQKITIAITPLKMAPFAKLIPVNKLSASPQPAILPILNANPPITMDKDKRYPSPGSNKFAISCARIPLNVMALQILICAPKSSRIETKMTNPKLVNSCSV